MKRTIIGLFLTLASTLPVHSDELTARTQGWLTQLGYNLGTVDGIYGPKTEQAIISFYEAEGIEWASNDISETLQLIESAAAKQMLNLAPQTGVEIENNIADPFLFPPEWPGLTRQLYWFGLFWMNVDWNGDDLRDFIYTGTMIPNNINVNGQTTKGLCGWDACEGEMPGPTLYLQQTDGSYLNRSDLFIDNRARPGQSLARQNLAGDYNGDDILDLYVADTGVGTTNGFRDSYFLSQADGTWLESSTTHMSHPTHRNFNHGAATGDIDGDGDLDIVLTELANRLTCLINDGTGYLSKRTCSNIHAFAIELGDFDGDGDLDLIHGGHEQQTDPRSSSTRTGIALNDGTGSFSHQINTPQIDDWGTIPEVSVWDLDDDGDLDILLSRAGHLYVGTAVQILENLGNNEYNSTFYPLVTPPADYVPSHEGNEWNNFVTNFLFQDIDGDGDHDIILTGGGNSEHQALVRAAIFRNEGNMEFSHIPHRQDGNSIEMLMTAKFSDAGASIPENLRASRNENLNRFLSFLGDKVLSAPDEDEFLPLSPAILLPETGASIVSVANADFGTLSGSFDAMVAWGGEQFPISICIDRYNRYDFTAFRVNFKQGYGFGGLDELESLGVNSCSRLGDGAASYSELPPQAEELGITAFVTDLQNEGFSILEVFPGLSADEQVELSERYR